jgi:hypothetical protein
VAVPYGLELPRDRARHYSAVQCEFCWARNDLKPVGEGRFRCSECVDGPPAWVRHQMEALAYLEEIVPGNF